MKKLSIISFSGDFDKLTAVFTLATGAAAVGYEVNIFFTFWGLDAIKVKQGRAFVGGSWLTKIWLYRFCPWIAHAKTVSQISPSNGTLFKIKV